MQVRRNVPEVRRCSRNKAKCSSVEAKCSGIEAKRSSSETESPGIETDCSRNEVGEFFKLFSTNYVDRCMEALYGLSRPRSQEISQSNRTS